MAQEEQGQPAPQPEPGAEERKGEAEEAAPEFAPVDVYGVVRYCISLLHAHAWQSMGLVTNPVTKTVLKDMDQARAAIDSVSALMGQLEGHLEAAQMRELRAMLSDLQVNFVAQQAKRD